MRNNNYNGIKKICLIFGVVLLIAVLVFVCFKVILGNKKVNKENMVILENAPDRHLHPNFEDYKKTYVDELGRETEYYIDEKGNLHVIKDGEDYTITSDGKVMNSKGEFVDNADVLKLASEIASKDNLVSNLVNADDLKRNTLIKDLSDSEKMALSDKYGLDIDKLLSENPNLTLADLEKLANNKKELEEDVEKSKLDLVKQFLKEMGMDENMAEDILKRLEENGIGIDQFFDDVLKKGGINALKGLGIDSGNEVKEKKKDNMVKLGDGTYLDTTTGKKYKDLGNGKFAEISDTNDLYEAILKGTENPVDMSALSETLNTDSYIKQNGQSDKLNFLKSKQNGTKVISKKIKDNMLVNGTVINGLLITGINTDLPSATTVGLVSENVYDSFTNTNILIPKGSKVIASINSTVTYGQDRVQIVWETLIRPDGVIIQLNGYNGTDRLGYTGMGGRVNNHIGGIIGGTVLSSIVKIGSKTLSNNLVNTPSGFLTNGANEILGGTAESTEKVLGKLLEKVVDRQPTITVEPGTRLTIISNDNIELPIYEY